MVLFWVFAILGAVLGGLNLLFTLVSASSAPQQAAGYAFSCALAVVPYVMARAVQSLGKGRVDAAADKIVAAIEKAQKPV